MTLPHDLLNPKTVFDVRLGLLVRQDFVAVADYIKRLFAGRFAPLHP